jgi:hypothetical protein
MRLHTSFEQAVFKYEPQEPQPGDYVYLANNSQPHTFLGYVVDLYGHRRYLIAPIFENGIGRKCVVDRNHFRLDPAPTC